MSARLCTAAACARSLMRIDRFLGCYEIETSERIVLQVRTVHVARAAQRWGSDVYLTLNLTYRSGSDWTRATPARTGAR